MAEENTLVRQGEIVVNPPRSISWPVIPAIPAYVQPNTRITSAQTNSEVKCLEDIWTNLQAVGTAAMADPTTTKGDLIVRGPSTTGRLPVGANGQVIVADSAQASGMSWRALSPADAGAVPVSRQVIAGAGLGGGGPLTADVTLTANVRTVMGRTGDVVLTAADITGAGGVPATRSVIAGAGLAGGGALSADVTLTANVKTVQGRTGDVVVSLSELGGVPATRSVIAGAGMTGGGPLSADVTLNARVTSVMGRTGDVVLTSADIATAGLPADASVQKVRLSTNGTFIAARQELNLIEGVNVNLAAVDNSGANRVDVTITATAEGGAVPVPDTRQVLAGTGLIGGGPLSADVTLSIGTVPIANLAAGDYSSKVTSGTYSISVTGSAGSVPWSGVTGKPSASTYQTPWLQNIDGGGFTLTNVQSVGINAGASGWSLDVRQRGAALESTAGAIRYLMDVGCSNGNNDRIETTIRRDTAGGNWDTCIWVQQRVVDSSPMQWVKLGPGGEAIAMGGSTTFVSMTPATFSVASNQLYIGQGKTGAQVPGTDWASAPVQIHQEKSRIAFHWPGVASQIGIHGNGDPTVRTFDNPGTGYESFACKNMGVNGSLTVSASAGDAIGIYTGAANTRGIGFHHAGTEDFIQGYGNPAWTLKWRIYNTGNIWTVGDVAAATFNSFAIQGDSVYPGANQILRTGSNGITYTSEFYCNGSAHAGAYCYSQIYNMSFPEENNPIGWINYISTSNDGFMRRCSLAHLNNSISPHWANVQSKPDVFYQNYPNPAAFSGGVTFNGGATALTSLQIVGYVFDAAGDAYGSMRLWQFNTEFMALHNNSHPTASRRFRFNLRGVMRGTRYVDTPAAKAAGLAVGDLFVNTAGYVIMVDS